MRGTTTKEGCLSAQHQEIHVQVKLAEQSKIAAETLVLQSFPIITESDKLRWGGGGGVREVWITFTEKTTDQLNTVAEKHRPLGQTAKRKKKEKKMEFLSQ